MSTSTGQISAAMSHVSSTFPRKDPTSISRTAFVKILQPPPGHTRPLVDLALQPPVAEKRPEDELGVGDLRHAGQRRSGSPRGKRYEVPDHRCPAIANLKPQPIVKR
jgi:hypothetical protein